MVFVKLTITDRLSSNSYMSERDVVVFLEQKRNGLRHAGILNLRGCVAQFSVNERVCSQASRQTTIFSAIAQT